MDSFFSRAFPDLPAVVANILNHLEADHGCLVCGRPSPARKKKFRELANQGICPFCESKNVRTERVTALSARANSYIFTGGELADLMKVLDPEWPGGVPHTIVVGPAGEVIWRRNGPLDGDELRGKIFEYMGAFYTR